MAANYLEWLNVIRPCYQCDQEFNCNEALAIHKRTHTGERPFKCCICGDKFISDGALEVHHLNVHANKKPKPALVVQPMAKIVPAKIFPAIAEVGGAYGTAVRRFAIPLEQTKPFKCKLCPKRFARKEYLRTHHLNIHAEKKFKCRQCDKRFGRQGGLNQHMKTHQRKREQLRTTRKRLRTSSESDEGLMPHFIPLRKNLLEFDSSDESQTSDDRQPSPKAKRKISYRRDRQESDEKSDEETGGDETSASSEDSESSAREDDETSSEDGELSSGADDKTSSEDSERR